MASRSFGLTIRKFCTSSVSRGKLTTAPTQVFGIDGRYSHAIYSAASKEKKLDVVEKELNDIKALIEKDLVLATYIANPTIRRQDKQKTLTSVLQKKNCSKLTINLFASMAENGRLRNVTSVLNTFNRLMSAHRGEVLCSVTTAKALDANNLKELNEVLKTFLKKGQTLQLQTKVDPTLIGGMVVNIGDRYVDMSMATKIKTYTNIIKQAV